MQIGKINPQTFSGVHIVRVPKGVFKDSSIEDCTIKFNDIACEALEKNNKYSLKEKIGLKLQTAKAIKVYDVLESPGYDTICQVLPKYKPSHIDASWLYLHTKTPITLPESEDSYKFYVLTGEEKNKVLKAFSWINMKKLERKASKMYEKTNDKISDTLREFAKLSQILDEKFHSIIDGKPQTEWRANSEEELEKVIVDINKLND